ncbi:uncharacterized protein METZ01_LOCUS67948 [marine metagenome]|uniref:Uncharacterized protein n=1 Tax=marine metagenome TaxID=408172 RepID=A0A381TH47_9ZZZZ
MAIKLTPKCTGSKGYGYSAKGYIIPCCWCDPIDGTPGSKDEVVQRGFFQEHLHISKAESIEEIISDKVWVDFFDGLINDPENAMSVCKRWCGTEMQNKIHEKFGRKSSDMSTSNFRTETKGRNYKREVVLVEQLMDKWDE